jgi:putative transposase
MKKSRFNEKQILAILKEQEMGKKITEICREHGISEQTFQNWRKKYSGITVDNIKRLCDLEQENARLKRILADLSLDLQMSKDIISKKY